MRGSWMRTLVYGIWEMSAAFLDVQCISRSPLHAGGHCDESVTVAGSLVPRSKRETGGQGSNLEFSRSQPVTSCHVKANMNCELVVCARVDVTKAIDGTTYVTTLPHFAARRS